MSHETPARRGPHEAPRDGYEPPTPAARDYEPPVRWLLGRELIASLKLTLLYVAFGAKLDPRDWMHAEVFPSDERRESLRYWKALAEGRPSPCDRLPPADGDAEAFWRDTRREFWFDYISDTGDGMKATYGVAYLCLSNLWVEDLWEQLPPPDRRGVMQEPAPGYGQKLPRGAFLFVGGDTTYHLADYAGLANRFKLPFEWAYHDLKARIEQRVEEHSESAGQGLALDEHRHPLFGIPGNHDYYDMLDGFRRQFRRPVRPEPEDPRPAHPSDTSGPQLMIAGFQRCQESSYVALQLPFGWWLWGLDTEVGEIDARQTRFFKELNGGQTPEKLIVATCSPTTVFGRYAERDDRKSSKAFLQLGLPRVFLPQPDGTADDKYAAEEGEPPRALDPRHIRLDLSGDVHHYARYWGPPPAPASAPGDDLSPPRQGRATRAAFEPHANYASVVSGLGGAFHHPSDTYCDEVREAALYPPEGESRREVAGKIFNPLNVIGGGYVWLLGAVIAAIIFFAATYVASARDYWSNSFVLTRLRITEEVPIRPTVPLAQPAKVTPFAPWRWVGLAPPAWSPPAAGPDCGQQPTRFFWGKCALPDPPDYILGWALAVASLGIIILTFWKTEQLYKISGTSCETPEKNAAVACRLGRWLWSLCAVFTLVVALCILTLRPYRTFISPYGNSLLTLLSMVWAVAGAGLSMRYSDWLFEQASRRTVSSSDWWVTWVLGGGAVLGLAAGLWIFGQNNLPAFLAADLIFTVVLAGVTALIIYLAYAAGGELLGRAGKVGMLGIGLWHAALQIFLPFLLVRKGTWLTLALAALLVPLFMKAGERLMKSNRRGLLVATWLAYGALMLLLPAAVFAALRLAAPSLPPGLLEALFWPFAPPKGVALATYLEGMGFAAYEWWNTFRGWWGLVPTLFAAALGAFLCCAWFGWYLAVCLGFNGHNNEVGGAARIERFKQFIRFRLTEEDITGYVIAFDDPQADGQRLKPKLVDVFRLRAKRPAGGADAAGA